MRFTRAFAARFVPESPSHVAFRSAGAGGAPKRDGDRGWLPHRNTLAPSKRDDDGEVPPKRTTWRAPKHA